VQSRPKVVFYLISSSNHNLSGCRLSLRMVVFYLISSSNHNPLHLWLVRTGVVFYLISSSNHNLRQRSTRRRARCLLSHFIIKPQLVMIYYEQ